MRIRNKIRWFMLLGLINCGTAAYSQDVLLVANPGVHISRISDEDARAIFLRAKTRLADGSHPVPVTLKGGPVHEIFLRNHVGESPDEFRAQRRAVFTGQGAIPHAFENEAALIEAWRNRHR